VVKLLISHCVNVCTLISFFQKFSSFFNSINCLFLHLFLNVLSKLQRNEEMLQPCLSHVLVLIYDANKEGWGNILGCAQCHDYCANEFYSNTPWLEQLNVVTLFSTVTLTLFSHGTMLQQSIYNYCFCSLLANKWCFPKYNNIACRVVYFCIAEQNSVTGGKK